MPPSAAELAIKGCLSQTYGRQKNLPSVVTKLTAHFVGRGESLADLPLPVDTDDVAPWEAEWMAHMTDAGCTSSADKVKLIQWLKARGGATTGREADSVKSWANDVLTDLEAIGVVLDPRQTAELRAKIGLNITPFIEW